MCTGSQVRVAFYVVVVATKAANPGAPNAHGRAEALPPEGRIHQLCAERGTASADEADGPIIEADGPTPAADGPILCTDGSSPPLATVSAPPLVVYSPSPDVGLSALRAGDGLLLLLDDAAVAAMRAQVAALHEESRLETAALLARRHRAPTDPGPRSSGSAGPLADDESEAVDSYPTPPNGTLAQQLCLRRGSLRPAPALPPPPPLTMSDDA